MVSGTADNSAISHSGSVKVRKVQKSPAEIQSSLADTEVIDSTEKTDFDINALPNRKFTFYLSVPALVFNYLLNFIQDSHCSSAAAQT